MEAFFIGTILLLLVWVGILSARLACYKKQLRHMLKELQIAKQDETNILFTSVANIGQTEEIIRALNHIMEKTGASKSGSIRKTGTTARASQAFPMISVRP